MKLIKKQWMHIAVISILLIAALLRFYDYNDRWGLAYDQAHDALVARGALTLHKIPLVGPFSSAGPFQTGGIWYWGLMVGAVVAPSIVNAPWILITLLSLVYILFLMYVGRKLLDSTYSLILGILAAFSTAQIGQAVNLSVTAPMALASLFAIWAMINYVREKTNRNIFLLGFAVALAPTIHLQGMLLFLLLPITFLLSGVPPFKKLPLLALGMLIPFTSLLFFEVQNDFVNVRNMVQYYLHDQYNISLDVLGRRWLTYIGVFWPKAIALIVGGKLAVGYILSIFVVLVLGYSFVKKTLEKEIMIIILTFLVITTLIRYVRTPIFDSYLVMLHTFVFIFIAYVLYVVWKKKRIVGVLILLVLVVGSSLRTFEEISYATNKTAKEAGIVQRLFSEIFPGQKFQVYDYQYKTSGKSLPITLYLDAANKVSGDGMKIGVIDASVPFNEVIYKTNFGYLIVDLRASTSAELEKNGWELVNPTAVYLATEEWYR